MAHELLDALLDYIATGSKTAITFLKNNCIAIDSQLKGKVLQVKVNAGLFKTESHNFSGDDAEYALRMLWKLRQFLPNHVKRPRSVGAVDKRLAQILRNTFG